MAYCDDHYETDQTPQEPSVELRAQLICLQQAHVKLNDELNEEHDRANHWKQRAEAAEAQLEIRGGPYCNNRDLLDGCAVEADNAKLKAVVEAARDMCVRCAKQADDGANSDFDALVIRCPSCGSPRIGSFRLDIDWGYGGDWSPVNAKEHYPSDEWLEMDRNERVCDINCYVCHACEVCFDV